LFGWTGVEWEVGDGGGGGGVVGGTEGEFGFESNEGAWVRVEGPWGGRERGRD